MSEEERRPINTSNNNDQGGKKTHKTDAQPIIISAW
jgi:hypothetical protein